MKLRLVPAATGLTWVKLGVKTFFRQPLALAGLFFMFMAVISVLSLVPLLGAALSLVLLPAATVGLMAASREASQGRFPMPTQLAAAFRAGPQRLRAMLTLGLCYAVGLLLVMGISSLFDGGEFASMYLGGAAPTPENVRAPGFQTAMWAGMALYVPLAMVFWHAPALVLWHGVSPAKSLFFSLTACWRNKGAMLVFMLGWLGLFVLIGLVIGLAAGLLGGGRAVGLALYPAVLVMASMFFASIYFTFRDCFDTEAPADGGTAP